MSFLRLHELPFEGMSYEFHGDKQGAPISAYLVQAPPGKGPPLHQHPYVETLFMIEGRARVTIGDETREVGPGEIAVVPAHTPHRFINIGQTTLRQIDVHASPTFLQKDLE